MLYTERSGPSSVNSPNRDRFRRGPAPSRMRKGRRQRHLCCLPESRDHGGQVRVVEQEQFTRRGHLAEHLSRFGHPLSGIGERSTTNKLFWSV